MDMTDSQINALLDEMEACRKRADDYETKFKRLRDAVDWMSMGLAALTSDEMMPDLGASLVADDDMPVSPKDASFGAALYAVRHGVMVSMATLRDDPPRHLREMAQRLAGDSLDIMGHDLEEQSMLQMLKMAFYLKQRGVEGVELPSL